MLLEYCLYVRNDNYQQESKEGDSSESGNELTLLSGQGTESDQRSDTQVRNGGVRQIIGINRYLVSDGNLIKSGFEISNT